VAGAFLAVGLAAAAAHFAPAPGAGRAGATGGELCHDAQVNEVGPCFHVEDAVGEFYLAGLPSYLVE
jgi:cytochrome c551/c552